MGQDHRAHDEQDIKNALADALKLLDRAGHAYQSAPPTIRRMLNQPLFDGLCILDDEILQGHIDTPH